MVIDLEMIWPILGGVVFLGLVVLGFKNTSKDSGSKSSKKSSSSSTSASSDNKTE